MKHVFLLDVLILIASYSNVYTIKVKDPWIPVTKLFESYDWPKRQGALDSSSQESEAASEEVETQPEPGQGQGQGQVKASQPLHEPNSYNLTVPIEPVQLPEDNSNGYPDQPYPILTPANFYPPIVTDYPQILREPTGPDQSSILWNGNGYPWQGHTYPTYATYPTYPTTLGHQMVSPSTSFVNASGPQFPTVPTGLDQPLPLGQDNFGPPIPTVVMGPDNQYFPPSPQNQMIPPGSIQPLPIMGQDNLGPPIPMIVMVPEVPFDPLVPYHSIAPVGPHPSVG